MTNLQNELEGLFDNDEKSQEMMSGDCVYDPAYTPPWQKEPILLSAGYGKELQEIGVDYQLVESDGGEGQGDQYWAVWEFTRGEEVARFKFEGWYASYHGAEFERVYAVEPVQKWVTVWE